MALSTLAALAAMTAPAIARADNASLAESLFRDGRAAMRDGDYLTACPRLAESQRLDPSTGTLLNLALCEEQLGHIATAWAHFRAVVDQAPEKDDRAPIARDHTAALAPRLPWLRIIVSGVARQNATILLDGVELHEASIGGALPVDPGNHVLIGRSDGATEQRVVFTIAEAEKRDETIAFTPLAPPFVGTSTTRATQLPPTSSQSSESRSVVEYTLFGVGAAGIVASVVLAGFARGKQSDVDQHCHQGGCDSTGLDAARLGSTYERWATVAFIGGTLAIGGGTWLAITAPTASPSAGGRSAATMIRLGGTF